MNVRTLITEAQRLANRVDADYDARTRRWLNTACEQWALSIPWPGLTQRENIVTTGNQTLVLPQRVWSVRWLGDVSNKRIIRPNDYLEREFETTFFAPQTSDPFFYRERGVTPVTAQPPSASYLIFNTTSSDSFNVYVSGLVQDTRASGTPNEKVEAQESIAIGGTTSYTSTNRYLYVFTIGKDDFTVADLVGYNGSDVIARVEARRYRSEYRQLEFIHTPPAGRILSMEYLMRPESLVDNFQIPNPSIEPDYLINFAAAKIHVSQNRPELAAGLMAEARAIIERAIYKERMHKEVDLRATPDPLYISEDPDVWPNTGHW